jgi:hypothetical protein
MASEPYADSMKEQAALLAWASSLARTTGNYLDLGMVVLLSHPQRQWRHRRQVSPIASNIMTCVPQDMQPLAGALGDW